MRKKIIIATNAAKYALWMSAAYITLPTVIDFNNGVEVTGNIMAQRFVVGISWFLIIFIGLFLKNILSKHDQSIDITPLVKEPKQTSKWKSFTWNILMFIAAPLSLWYFFGQAIIEGSIENKYWLGVAFWIVMMLYSGRNLFLIMHRKYN